MTTLLSINSYHYVRGGADVVYFDHAKLFAEHGWNTTFFSMHHDENVKCDESDYFVDCIDYAKGGAAGRNLKNAAKIIYSLEASRKLDRLLAAKPADVAHVHNIYHHLSPSVLVTLKRHSVPVVMTAHDLKLLCPNNKMLNSRLGVCERCAGGALWNAVRYRCIKGSLAGSALIAVETASHRLFGLYNRFLDRIVAPSRFYRDKLVQWGWDPARVVHIPNAVEMPAQRPVLPGTYILYFGRLTLEKGLKTLVEAAALSGVPVRLAGVGPDEALLRRIADERSAPVEFLGFRSGQDLWSQVDNARAIVLPSEWYENGPMSVIEAFARGKPLIGARSGGIPELIEEGATGWSFEAGNPEALAAILKLVNDLPNGRFSEMAEATIAFVRANHSREVYFQRMAALYAGLGVRGPGLPSATAEVSG